MASTRATVSPMTEGCSATVTPAAVSISTFSEALSPKAEMIAPAVLFLLEDASLITGEILQLDAGNHLGSAVSVSSRAIPKF